MIEPACFGYNAETAVNNAFQVNTAKDVQQIALKEFNDIVNLLRSNKINVTVFKDSIAPPTPDSIFPNNWISFHDNGSIFIYPMFAANRRAERNFHIIETLKQKFNFKSVHDLSAYEKQHLFLEGTGSMVLDRVNRIAYACLSPRTNTSLLNRFCAIAGYSSVTFSATDKNDEPIYHSNVMMCMGDRFAVLCLDSIRDISERETLISSLKNTGKDIIEISLHQLHSFAGNMLQIINTEGELLLAMSTRAYSSLNEVQVNRLNMYSRIIHSSLDCIETAGGGSARCMMAEIFHKKKP